MKTKIANFAFLLLLVIFLMAGQMHLSYCSPDLLYLRTGTVPDSPSPSPAGEQLHWEMGTVVAEIAVDSTTTDVYWYSQRYTGTVSAGDWTAYIWMKKDPPTAATCDYILEKRAPDGTLVSTIGTQSYTSPATYTEITLTYASISATTFNDERLCLHIQYVSGGGSLHQYNYDALNDADSRIVTPSGSPPIPEFPSIEFQIAIVVINLVIISHLLRKAGKSTCN